MRKDYILKSLLLLGGFLLSLPFLSQRDSLGYNAAYWSGYADKLQLPPEQRLEFLNAHKRLKDGVPTTHQQQPFTTAAKNSTASTFAGPCINADFETGNFSGWNRSSGYHPLFNAAGCCPNAGGQQLITSGAGVDPFGGFPVVFPGGNFSLRLGTSGTGGEADRIEQTFLVSTNNANFTYRYAVVLEDPGHANNQQPAFLVEMLDSTGAQIPCTYYYVAAGQGIPGFFNSSTAGVIYKPWTTVALNLNPYIGQNLTIRFSTYDCSLGGHFGYAYIDGVCQSFTGNGADTICAGSNTVFCAPVGMASYTWNGPGITNLVNNCATVAAQGIYTVQTELFTGCPGPSFTYSLTLQNSPTITASADQTVCANNASVTINSTITGYPATPQWTTSGTGNWINPFTNTAGYLPSAGDKTTGTVSLVVSTIANGKCGTDADTVVINITPAPILATGGTATICSINTHTFNATASSTFSGVWTTSGSGTFTPSAAALNAIYQPGTSDILNGTVPFTLTSTNNGNCIAVTTTFVLYIHQQPTLTAATLPTICSTASLVALNSTVTGITNSAVWSSNGTGTLLISGNSNAAYYLSLADKTLTQLSYTLTSTNNGACAASSSVIPLTITPLATVTAGNHQRLCSTQNSVGLNGTVIGGTSTGLWSNSGSGTLSPSNAQLTTNYFYSSSDIQNGLVTFTLSSTNNGVCPSQADTLSLRIVQQATIAAIPNRTLCSHLPSTALTATVNGFTSTGIWSTSGTGTIANTNSTTTNYTFSPVDVLNSPVLFTLTSTNNDVCAADTRTASITIVPIATVNAGPNQFVCSAQTTIALSGTITGGTSSGIWSSVTGGVFAPSTSLTSTYSLNTIDINNGFITLTLSSTNNGTCPARADTVRMKIMKQPVITVPSSNTLCSTQPTFQINGSLVGGINQVLWSTSGSGTFANGATAITNIYQIAPNDVQAGVVIFTLASVNSTPCPEASGTLSLQLDKIAQVVAGSPQVLCSNTPTLSLLGNIGGGATTGTWSSTGSGGYPVGNVPVTTYTLSGADRFKTQLLFTLTSVDNGVCPPVRDTVRITLHTLPVVKAGSDKGICNTQSLVPLNGQVAGYTNSGIWSTTGAGSFVPSPTLMNSTYLLAPSDFVNGKIEFVLTSTNNGVCPAILDTLLVSISKAPVVNIQSDSVVCEKQNPVALNASILFGSGLYEWQSSGTGTFLPNPNRSSVNYLFSSTDVKNGYVYFSLITKNNGACGNMAFPRTLQLLPSAHALFNASTYTLTLPEGAVAFTNLSKQAETFQWQFGDGTSSTLKDPTTNYKFTGYYDVVLIADNKYHCSDTTVQRITVISEALFPNAFTPNATGPSDGRYNPLDNSNDVFFPFTDGVINYDLQIYNRWGELIFRSTDVKIGWDGYFNGKMCQQDTYVWKANMEFFDGRKLIRAGTITLLR